MQQALYELRWLDALDVLFVAALLYAAMRWLRRSQVAPMALGIALLGSIWALARALDLELLSLAFQAFSALVLVGVVVVFQEELRRGFEDLAGWALGRRGDVRPRLDTKDVLVESLERLASRKVGALIVIPGLQPVRRHVHGGIELGGRLSVPLLESLFDTHTPGHDGAVIVENRSVTWFGVQLPLSRSSIAHGDRGTRHSAALGLSEHTDALCLVVSEERGSISLATGGLLRQLANAREAGPLLDRFFRRNLPLEQRRAWIRRAIHENRTSKVAALALSAVLWLLFVPGSRTVELTLSVPVEVSGLPHGKGSVRVDPSRVRTTLEGTRRDFLMLDPRSLHFQLDGRSVAGNRAVELSAAQLVGQGGVAVREVHPSTIRIALGDEG